MTSTGAAAPIGTVELRGGSARVELMPALGGKISRLWFGDRQWLWHNDQLPFRLPTPGASYHLTADSGGFDECFPTVGPCVMPSIVKGFGGRELPDHGELWAQAPAVRITTDPAGHRAECAWQGAALPYAFTRTIVATPAGEVRCEYAVRNTGEQRLPFIWSAHPLFPLTDATQVELPEGARVRVWAEHGVDLGGVGAEHRWPRVRAGGQLLDFSQPGRAWKKPFACKLFVDLPPRDVAVTVREGNDVLCARFDARDVRHVGLWVNRGGWTPLPRTSWLPWRKPAPYHTLALEPCIGAGDTLSEALGAWDSAAWLERGAERRWAVTWSATPPSDGTGAQ